MFALISIALLVGGCGDNQPEAELPSNAVARVDSTLITRADFDEWVRKALATRQARGQSVTYKPPEYAACVASKRAKERAAADASKQSLRRQCEKEYDFLEYGALQGAIRAEWVRQEAARRGLQISSAELDVATEQSKSDGYKNEKEFDRYLAAVGWTREDYRAAVKVDELAAKLSRLLTSDVSDFSADELAQYYRTHMKEYVQGERRGVRLVATSTRDRAAQARKALETGQPWRRVIETYATPDTAGFLAKGVVPFDRGAGAPDAVDRAIFAAPMNKLSGPIRGEGSWLVFEVEWKKPARQRSLAESREDIRTEMKSKRDQAAEEAFVNRYRTQTTCARGFIIPDCRNAPKTTPDEASS